MRNLILLALALGLASCTTYQHSAQAPRPARHTYHQAERQHARARHRQVPLNLPWN